MKKNKFFLAAFALSVVLGAMLASCVKDDYYSAETGGESNRKTVVQIIGAANLMTFARDVSPAIDTFILIDVRRYPNSEAELNQALTVKLQVSPTVITNYNTANGTNFVQLPSTAYTFLTDINNLTFQPGEAIKEIKIRVDKNQLDLSKQYALGVTINDPGANAVANTSLKNAIYSIGVKNKYDGTYSLRFSFYHPSASPDYGSSTATVELHTTGANSVKMYWPDAGGYFAPILSGGQLSYFGAQEPNFTVDPVTNKVTVNNSAVGGTVVYTTPASYNSRYDPATKTFYIRYGYNYSAGDVFNSATNREWTDTLKYIGPR